MNAIKYLYAHPLVFSFGTVMWRFLAIRSHNASTIIIGSQYIYTLLHPGTEPVQFPEWLQTRIFSPSRTKPVLQLYVAVSPSAVPLDETNPFSGSSSGPQLISNRRGRSTYKCSPSTYLSVTPAKWMRPGICKNTSCTVTWMTLIVHAVTCQHFLQIHAAHKLTFRADLWRIQEAYIKNIDFCKLHQAYMTIKLSSTI